MPRKFGDQIRRQREELPGANAQIARAASEHLSEQARELFGIDLSRVARDQLGRYLDMVWVWSRRTNLISVRSRGEIVDRHLLDSIAALRIVREAAAVADFGSGAGFPAVPLSILSPATRFHLVESRRRRAIFLRHVTRTLGLDNVRVYEGRGEDWRPKQPIDLTIGRAIRIDLLVELSLRVLRSNGLLVVMRKRADCELRVSGFRNVDRLPYDLPSGERHEIVVLSR